MHLFRRIGLIVLTGLMVVAAAGCAKDSKFLVGDPSEILTLSELGDGYTRTVLVDEQGWGWLNPNEEGERNKQYGADIYFDLDQRYVKLPKGMSVASLDRKSSADAQEYTFQVTIRK